MKTHFLQGHGGVELFVREVGPEDGRPIVLLHGWSQHHLCWSRQFESELADRYRLIAPDLRGHGASAKPEQAEAYDNPTPWAGDIRAIIELMGLIEPILVGWSMGGWVVCDYLSVHGDAGLGGIAIIGSSARTGRHADPALVAQKSPEARAEGMYSQDQAVNIPATIGFVKACFANPLHGDEQALLVAMNMLCPPAIRHACRTRSEDYRTPLANLAIPAMVVHGLQDRMCLRPMFDETRRIIPGAISKTYNHCGHAPFWEDAERFNADLLGFAHRVWGAAR